MKKSREIIFVVIAFVLIASVIVIPQHITNEREREEMRVREEARVRFLFNIQNSGLFGIVLPIPDHYDCIERMEEFVSGYLPANPNIDNIDGISYLAYITLAVFRRETDSTLSYEQIVEFLSQEFEDDGEIRIYNNGRHPKIHEFVLWRPRYFFLANDSDRELRAIYRAYSEENAGFPRISDMGHLPRTMLDALIRKETDPDYELDLTSIQNRYIEAGRAIVSEDGRTIEFIVTEHFLNRVDE